MRRRIQSMVVSVECKDRKMECFWNGEGDTDSTIYMGRATGVLAIPES